MKIRDPDLSNDPLQKEHAEVGLPQLEAGTFQGEKHPFLFLFCWIAGFCMLLGFSVFGLKIYSFEWYKFLFNITRYFRDSRILEGIDHRIFSSGY